MKAGRRVMTLCKGEAGLRQQLALYQVYHNFCLPHASLRVPLPHPEPTNGSGSAKRGQPRTPAMAAGLTDHVWTLREVLQYRVPPWSQIGELYAAGKHDEREVEHPKCARRRGRRAQRGSVTLVGGTTTGSFTLCRGAGKARLNYPHAAGTRPHGWKTAVTWFPGRNYP